MATTTTITKLLFRRGNDADREQTILASGEPGWTLDTKRLWIGDGVTPGGYPALSARDAHLHYVDTQPSGRRWTTTGENNFGGAQFLDINIPGLSDTLAGEPIENENQRWFHPVKRDIETRYNMHFHSEDAEITHSGSGVFKIHKTNTAQDNNNSINIGDAIFIRPDGRVDINVPDDAMLVFNSASAVFDNGRFTHFEDKSIDLNTVFSGEGVNREFTGAGNGAMSEDTGIYFTHNNYLSAGFLKIGGVGDATGWSTLEFSPTVYLNDWESYGNSDASASGGPGWDPAADRQNFAYNVTKRAGALRNRGDKYIDGPEDGTMTVDWTREVGGKKVDKTKSIYTPKPLIFHSARPDANVVDNDFRNTSYDGNAHFVFESGLIVYDAGDPEAGGYNAYLLNQSLDTRAIPTFAGIKIEKADGTPGDPMGVSSGGTGVNAFNAGGVLYTSGKHTDSSHASDLLSMSLERGDIMVGTTSHGVVKSKFDHNNWIDILYDEPVTVPGRNIPPDGQSGQEPGRRDGVIYIGNKFAPDYLKYNTEIRERWFARWTAIKTDSLSLSALGTPEIPGEVLTIRGDYNASGNTGSSSTEDGGTIRTEAYNSKVLNEQGIQVLHNSLASTAFGLGQGSGVNTWDLSFFRGDSNKKVTVTTLFAGLTQSANDRYFGSLIPTDQTSAESSNPTPSVYRNNGMAIGGITINNEGHVIGMRSKDFDVRYGQVFHVGTKPYRGSKDNGIYSPDDHDENISNVMSATTGLPVGSAPGTLARSEQYLNKIVLKQNDVTGFNWHMGHDYFETDYYMSADSTNNITGYENRGSKDTEVVTELHFNDYGTVKNYNVKNLNDIFYDKDQISVIADWIDMRLTDHDTWINELSAAAFLRDTDSQTRHSKAWKTKWLDNSEVWFRGTTSGRENIIYADNSTWYQTVNPACDLQYTISNGKSVKWIQEQSAGTRTMMTLDAAGNNTSYDTRLTIYDGGTPKLRWMDGKMNISEDVNVTSLAKTVIGNNITTQKLFTKSDVSVGNHLYLGTEVASRTDADDGKLDNLIDTDIYIYFKDKSSNSATANFLKWDDSENDLRTSGDFVVGDDLTVTDFFKVNGNTQLAGTALVSGKTTLNGELEVAGKTTINNDTYVSNDLYVGSNDQVDSTIHFYDDKSNQFEGYLTFTKGTRTWGTSYFRFAGANTITFVDMGATVHRDLWIGDSVESEHTDPSIVLRDGAKKCEIKLISSTSVLEFSKSTEIKGDLEVNEDITARTLYSRNRSTFAAGLRFVDTVTSHTSDINHTKGSGYVITGSNVTIDEQLIVKKASEFQNNLSVLGQVLSVGSDKVPSGTSTTATGDSVIRFYDNRVDKKRDITLDATDSSFKCHDASDNPTLRKILHEGNYADILNNGPVKYLQKDAKAADSDLLDGLDSSDFARAKHVHKVADITDLEARLSNLGNLYLSLGGGTLTGDLTCNTHVTIKKNLNVDTTITCKGDIIAFSSSDITLKDNLKPIENALEKTNKLTGYEFDWDEKKQSAYKGHDVGVVAQEVEQVLPEVVNPRDDGTLGVNYEKIVPLLIESIKELTKQVEDLKSKLK